MLYNSGYLALEGVFSTVSATSLSSGTITSSGLITANAGITVTTGHSLIVGTSGTTSTATIRGLLTGTAGFNLTGTAALQDLTATTSTFSGLVTASAGLTVADGQTLSVGTTGATSTLQVYGALNGITATFSGLLTASAGASIPLGQTLGVAGTLSVTGTASIATLTATSATATNLTVTSTLTLADLAAQAASFTTVTASGLITANAGLTVATGQILNVGTSGSTSPLNVYGLLTGYNGMLISAGSSTVQALSALSLAVSTTATVGTSLTVSGSSSLQDAAVAGALTCSGAVVRAVTQTAATSYSITGNNPIVEFTAATGTVTATLPALSGSVGKEIILVNASSSNAVVNVSTTEKINGATSQTIVLADPGSSTRVVAGNSSWYIV